MLAQVFLDRERDAALEAGRGQDVAVVTGIGEPADQRAHAVRDAGRRIADAVIVDEQEPHN